MPSFRQLSGSTLGSLTACSPCGGQGAGYYAQHCNNPGSDIFVSSVEGCVGNQSAILTAPFNNLSVGNVVKVKLVNCNGIESCVEINMVVNGNFLGLPTGLIDENLNPSFAAFPDCPTCENSTLGGGSGSGGSGGGGGGGGSQTQL